jgi:predicted transcriptional regulator
MSDPEERTVPLGFYAPEAMAEQLRETAREQDRSVSAVIRQAVTHELQREKAEVAPPFVRLAATEEMQAGNTYEAVRVMLTEGPLSHAGLDIGLTRTFLPGGGKILPVTASAASKEGGKETFACFDETSLYVMPELHRMYETIRRTREAKSGRTVEPGNDDDVRARRGVGCGVVAPVRAGCYGGARHRSGVSVRPSASPRR